MLKLILEYSKLAAALDTTRHHMSVNGVFIPQNHGTVVFLCLVLCSSSFTQVFSALEFLKNYTETTHRTIADTSGWCCPRLSRVQSTSQSRW